MHRTTSRALRGRQDDLGELAGRQIFRAEIPSRPVATGEPIVLGEEAPPMQIVRQDDARSPQRPTTDTARDAIVLIMVARAAQEFDVHPHRMATALADPTAIERWSPIPFRVSGQHEGRLQSGDRLTIEAALVGRELRFDVDIDSVDETGLSLHAAGPFEVEATYTIERAPSRISAEVEIRGGGLRGRALAAAANTLLSAGILDDALARLVNEAEQAADGRGRLTTARARDRVLVPA